MRKNKLTGLVVTLFLILIIISIPVGGTVFPDRVEFNLTPGGSVVEYKDIDITLPEMADVLLSFDVSDSNSYFLNWVKAGTFDIITALNTSGVDINYGVSSHTDYPGNYASCGYADIYGNSGDPASGGSVYYPVDYPYHLDQSITDDESSVDTVVNGLVYRFGWDNPEDCTRVFYESYADPATGWRIGAKRVMVHFGDGLPHDCSLNTGRDPGRDEIINNSDDLVLEDVLNGMIANNVMLFEIQTDSSYPEYWTEWTGRTGGQFVPSVEQAVVSDVVGAITGGLTTTSVTNVHIEAQSGYETWVYSPWSDTGSNKTFDNIPVTFTVPAGTPARDYTFNVYVVDNTGVIFGIQNVTIHVVNQSAVTVTHIVPNNGSTNTTVRISNLAGNGFAPGARVYLIMKNNPYIEASQVSVDSSKKITCTFDLTHAQSGLWTVVVTNPDGGGSGSLIDGFTIDSPTRVPKK